MYSSQVDKYRIPEGYGYGRYMKEKGACKKNMCGKGMQRYSIHITNTMSTYYQRLI